MPKLRATPQELRERAVQRAVRRAMVDHELEYGKDVARRLGISPEAYGRYFRNRFQNANLSLFCRMARELEFTPRELCEMVGIPFREAAHET